MTPSVRLYQYLVEFGRTDFLEMGGPSHQSVDWDSGLDVATPSRPYVGHATLASRVIPTTLPPQGIELCADAANCVYE
jgi:hypothetical protein